MSAFHAVGRELAEEALDLERQTKDGLVAAQEAEMRPHAIPVLSNALRFILAGKAIVTVVSRRTGTRYTYKIQRAKARPGQDPAQIPWYVGGLCGPDNTRDYLHLGVLFPGEFGGKAYVHGRNSPLDVKAPIAAAAVWFFDHLDDPRLLDKVEVYHEARCGRCGRKLTVPESIETGMGAKCAGRET